MTDRKTLADLTSDDLDHLYDERDQARQHAAAIAAQRDRLRTRMNTLADRWDNALAPDKPYAQTLRAEISVAPFDPDGAMAVREYTERGRRLWAFRCWGTEACDGWLGLGHHTQASALLERERHVAEAHTAPEPIAPAIARVRALHVRNPHSGTCEHCSERDYPDYAVPFPCPTIRALDEPVSGPATTQTTDTTAARTARIRSLTLPASGRQLDPHLSRRLPGILHLGHRPTSLDMALIAEAADVSVDWLLYGDAATAGLREQLAATIESEIYEYRERTMLWEEGGITTEIARLATRGAMEALDSTEQPAAAWTPPPPGSTREHVYLSTGCYHDDLVLPDGRTGHQYCEDMTGLNGAKRPASCKHCGAKCQCPHHTDQPEEQQ
jgi:hypothetical protein